MSDGICGRCLIILNAASYVAARWQEGGQERTESPRYFNDPVRLRAWVDDVMTRSGADARFEIDATNQRMIAFSTWNGDEVCAFHLWTLAEAEMRQGRR